MTKIHLLLVIHFIILLTYVTRSLACKHCYALVLLRENDSFELAKPIERQAKKSTYPFGSDRKLYIACPSNPNNIMQYEDENLLYTRETSNPQERTNDQLTCPYEVRTTFQEEWQDEYLKLYKSLTALHVQTGTGGNLQLDYKDMYINQAEQIIKVSAFFWKAIVNYSPNGNFKEGIILVMENFPYPLHPTFVCKDKSKESNWPPNFIKTFTGQAHIYACELNQKNANFLGIAEDSEFRQASLLNLKDVSVLDLNGAKSSRDLFDEFQSNPAIYYYYHIPGSAL